MIMDIFGGFPGSMHDSHIFDSSLFYNRFEQIQIENIIPYKTYMDKGYRIHSHAIAAYHTNENTPQIHTIANAVMTGQRIGEWGIGKVYVMFPIIKIYIYYYKHKIYIQ